MDIFSLKGKIALVTGACGLLGKEHCFALAEAGATVIVADIDHQKSTLFAQQLGRKHDALYLDVTSVQSLREAANYLKNEYGKLDILVNNAAINEKVEDGADVLLESSFEHLSLEKWQKSMDVNVTGTFLCSQILGALMLEHGKGSIINIASTYGIVAPDQKLYTDAFGNQMFYKSAAYPTTKGAIISFTKYLAAYWGKAGIRVNAISPGGVENGQDPVFVRKYQEKTVLGRMAKSSDYQGALVYLASDASAYTTGTNLIVDGGFTTI